MDVSDGTAEQIVKTVSQEGRKVARREFPEDESSPKVVPRDSIG